MAKVWKKVFPRPQGGERQHFCYQDITGRKVLEGWQCIESDYHTMSYQKPGWQHSRLRLFIALGALQALHGDVWAAAQPLLTGPAVHRNVARLYKDPSFSALKFWRFVEAHPYTVNHAELRQKEMVVCIGTDYNSSIDFLSKGKAPEKGRSGRPSLLQENEDIDTIRLRCGKVDRSNDCFLDYPPPPSFEEIEQYCCNRIAIHRMVHAAKEVRAVVCVVDNDSFTTKRGANFIKFVERLYSRFPGIEDCMSSVFFLFHDFAPAVTVEGISRTIGEYKESEQKRLASSQKLLKSLQNSRQSPTDLAEMKKIAHEATGQERVINFLEEMGNRPQNMFVIHSLDNRQPVLDAIKKSPGIKKGVFGMANVGIRLQRGVASLLIDEVDEKEPLIENIMGLLTTIEEQKAQIKSAEDPETEAAQKAILAQIEADLQQQAAARRKLEQQRDVVEQEITKIEGRAEMLVLHRAIQGSLSARILPVSKEILYADLPFAKLTESRGEGQLQVITNIPDRGIYKAMYTLPFQWRKAACIAGIAGIGCGLTVKTAVAIAAPTLSPYMAGWIGIGVGPLMATAVTYYLVTSYVKVKKAVLRIEFWVKNKVKDKPELEKKWKQQSDLVDQMLEIDERRRELYKQKDAAASLGDKDSLTAAFRKNKKTLDFKWTGLLQMIKWPLNIDEEKGDALAAGPLRQSVTVMSSQKELAVEPQAEASDDMNADTMSDTDEPYPLHAAAKDDDLKIAKIAYKYAPERLYERDDQGKLPLYYAQEGGPVYKYLKMKEALLTHSNQDLEATASKDKGV